VSAQLEVAKTHRRPFRIVSEKRGA